MRNEGWIIITAMITLTIYYSPTITFAQWPITADPALTQNGLGDLSSQFSNQTLYPNSSTVQPKNSP
jgi:hypothetical protein